MKIFVFMGRNAKNKIGMSWKMWKIERKQCRVTVWFGPATVVKHRLTAVRSLQSRTWRFRTEALAKENEQLRINEKLNKGYERVAKRKA